MNQKSAIIAGAFGGIVPNLLRVAINLTSESPTEIIHGVLGYSLGMCVLALLGAVVTWAWQETNARRALYLGIGLPSLIQVAGLQATAPAKSQPKPPPLEEHSSAFPFVSSAYAEEPAHDQPMPGRKLIIIGKNSPPAYTLVFFQKDGQQVATKSIATPASATVDVPVNAASFAVQLGDSWSNRHHAPDAPNAVKQVEIEIKTRSDNGFFQAFGFGRKQQYSIDVDTKKVNP